MNLVSLPKNLNITTVENIALKINDGIRKTGSKQISLDFKSLHFCDPCGAVALANIIGYLTSARYSIEIINSKESNPGNEYLKSSGFFKVFGIEYSDQEQKAKSTTIPFRCFTNSDYMEYLYWGLTPWIAREVNLSEESIETIRTCLEEIFHNIEYHSGCKTGFTLSQHFPRKKSIKIAISDYGIGIPGQVTKILPDMKDWKAIEKACEEGFTTKSNVKNRGAGLALLIKYVVGKNNGTVEIRSGNGLVKAVKGRNGVHLEATPCGWRFPGTLVHVELRTDTLEALETDVAPEVFQW